MNKKLGFIIKYIIDPENINMDEVLDKLREYGDAEIVDVYVEEEKE